MKPLSYEQAKSLAHCRAIKYAIDKYNYQKSYVLINPTIKSSLSAEGCWYRLDEPIESFPASIAALLKGKHHEWVVIGIEKNGFVSDIWVNKGEDRNNVTLNCELEEIVDKCKQRGGYSIFCFHNHPNSDPAHYTTLIPSEQDKISAQACADFVCKEGINWFDFVCSSGDFIEFYSQISDSFQIDGSKVSDIIDIIGITPEMDFELQKELRQCKKTLSNKKTPSIRIQVCILIIVCILIFVLVGYISTKG